MLATALVPAPRRSFFDFAFFVTVAAPDVAPVALPVVFDVLALHLQHHAKQFVRQGSKRSLLRACRCQTKKFVICDDGKELLNEAHALGLLVCAWTVNEIEDIENMIDIGVDGIVTDYPDRVQGVLRSRGMSG